MKTYVVVYARDEAGWWIASVRGLRGCQTQGRSLEQARSRIHEAIEAATGEEGPFGLTERFELPSRAKQLIAQRQIAQKKLAADQTRAQAMTQRAVKTLVGDLKLSVRDAGAVLGLSHQRVQQLVDAAKD